MYVLNKLIWFFLNPVMIPIVIALFALSFKKRVLGWLALGMIWFESTLSAVCLLGLPLEMPYLDFESVESRPQADAIVLLGGGMTKAPGMVYSDMFEGADRVWHAARLWKAGKAPILVVSGSDDLETTVPLLLDFGVAREAIIVDNDSRNTYENSRFTEKLLNEGSSILLVTSAWHMSRSLGNFSKTSLKAIPAPADFSTCHLYYNSSHWWDWVCPSPGNIDRCSYLFKEWLGKLARK